MNYVERKVLECGYSFERTRTDYGIDAEILTFDERGEVESGTIRVQVKATDTLKQDASGRIVLQRVSTADLKSWLFELHPVLVLVYDAAEDGAYWLDVQEYVREQKTEWEDTRTVTLRIPKAHQLSIEAVRNTRDRKNRDVSEAIDKRGLR